MIILFIRYYITSIHGCNMDYYKFCNEIITSEDLDIFKSAVRVLCAASSGAGKSYLINRLILNNHFKFDKIFIIGSPNNNILENDNILKEKIMKLEYFPSIQEINEYGDNLSKLILLDDVYITALSNKNVISYYTHGRHSQISPILLSQNLFAKGKFSRDLILNCSHIILLRTRDLSQLSILSRQIYGKGFSNKIPDVYNFIAKKYKFPHLLIDLTGTVNEKLELRSNIIDSEENKFQTAYIYNQNK